MPTHQATVTAVVGNGRSVTSAVYKNIKEINLFLDKKMIQISDGNIRSDVDISAVTTFTVAISGGNYTLTLS